MARYENETSPLLPTASQPKISISQNTIRTAITLTWESIKYTVPVQKGRLFNRVTEQKPILKGVSGMVRPGQLLAIMGSTGAGKSTLLDILAQRKTLGTIEGSILVNGAPPNRLFKRISGYVTQDDCLLGTQTVFETLKFYADLKLPASVTAEQRINKVNQIIEELGLTKVRDSRVGTQFVRGISGGEKKRLSIGCELITDPGLLFLDEPTTGLDAYNAGSVMELLNSLAKNGRSIICTIHQPRSTIYGLFDQLMLLSQGEVVYYGPASGAIEFFNALNLHCQQFINPADFFIDAVIENEKKQAQKVLGYHTVDSEDGYKDLAKAYKQSQLHTNLLIAIGEYKNSMSKQTLQQQQVLFDRLPAFATSWGRQFAVLCARNIRNVQRSPAVSWVQLIQTIFMALLVGSIYFRISNEESTIQDRLGALFFIMTNQAFSSFSSLNLFLLERDLFNRERAAGAYYQSAYYVAKSTIEWPLQMLFPLVFSCIAYWMIGLQSNPARFGIFLLDLVLFTSVAGSLFLCVGVASPSAAVATAIAPIATVLFLIFGGFYINKNNIPVYYIWIHYISFFKYGYEVLCKNEFTGLKFNCTNSQICTGEEELRILGMSDVNIWENMMWLAIMTVGYRVLGYFCMRFFFREKR